jgi:hypothetical protein
MTITKFIGMDAHKESISIAVMNSAGKFMMECVIETKGSMLLQFIDGLRGDVHVTFEEGTWAAWLYGLLKPHVGEAGVQRRAEHCYLGTVTLVMFTFSQNHLSCCFHLCMKSQKTHSDVHAGRG